MQSPTEVTSNMVNYNLLVNRDALQIRNPEVYKKLRETSEAMQKAVKEDDQKSYAKAMVEHARRALVAIFENAGQAQRLAEFGLQAFHPDAIHSMLVNEGKIKENKEAEAEARAAKEAAELAEAQAEAEALKAKYSEEEEKIARGEVKADTVIDEPLVQDENAGKDLGDHE